jgi:hypothetical protein
LLRIDRIDEVVPSEQHIASDLFGMRLDQLQLRSLGMECRVGGNR